MSNYSEKREQPGTNIDEMDVFDSMRALLYDGVNLDDRTAVERALINPYADDEQLSVRFINWCIKAARLNKAAGRFQCHVSGEEGVVPPERDPEEGTKPETYGEMEVPGHEDDHRVVFSVPNPNGKGRILKAQTFTVPDSKGCAYILSRYFAEDETTVTLGVFDEDKIEEVAHHWLRNDLRLPH
jgi:hypothetical protein